jgi:4-amino-4-deoxy-L-arabinose transferase-like glycosyltransferase
MDSNFTFFEKIIIRYQYFLLLLILAFPLIWNLGALPIRLWDEARLVANTIEMYHNKNYIVTYFDGAPDMWNTKPPLMIWIHLIMVHLFGLNEWAFRISSALFGLLTCFFVFFFTKNKTKNIWIAFAAAIILVTARGFVDNHITRTGDYDALLIFLATSSLGMFYNYTETKNSKYLYIFALLISFAVLTKGPAIVLFFPALLGYLLLAKNLVPLLRNKHSYFALVLFLATALPYYFIREYYNPGYIQAVYNNELGGRLLNALEEKGGAWHYYLEGMTGRNFNTWFIFIPIGIYFLLKESNIHIKNYLIFCTTCAIGYFTMISVAKTKHTWYDAPAYPLFAVVVSYAIFKIIERTYASKENLWRKVTTNIFFILLFSTSYTLVLIENVISPNKSIGEGMYDMSYYIREHYLKEPNIPHNINILENTYMPTTYMYFEQIKQKGSHINFITLEQVPYKDTIWVQNNSLFQHINSETSIKIIDSWGSFKIFMKDQTKE